MEYEKISCDNYDIHLITNKKVHTIDISISFTENVNKEKMTYHNALVDILTFKTMKYPTNQALIRRCQELYSLKPVAYTTRYGNLLNTRFNISIVNSHYLHDTIVDNLLLLKEIIFHPLVIDGAFREEDVSVIKKGLESEVNEALENPRIYATLSMFQEMGNENYTLSSYSDLNILNKLTGKDLYHAYLEMLNHSKIDIFVAGDIQDKNNIVSIIQENFQFHNHYTLNNSMTVHKMMRQPIEKEETTNFSQSKIVLGYKIINEDSMDKYTLAVLDKILGNSVDSLFMRLIREEKSLCYYVNSFHSKLDNLLVVESGIKKDDYGHFKELVEEIIAKVQKGNFSNKLIQKAKEELLVNLNMAFNHNRNLINYYYGINVLNSLDIEKRKAQIKAVNKDDIIDLVKKMQLDVCFFLKGDL